MGQAGACSKDIAHSLILTLAVPRRATSDSNVQALTQYLTYGFQAAGYPIVCMESRGVHAALEAMRNKTDKNDARRIAQILRTGWYRSVHVKRLKKRKSP